MLPGGLALSNQEPDLPSITRVGNIRPDGSTIPSGRFAEYWHHDGDFWILDSPMRSSIPCKGPNWMALTFASGPPLTSY
jgi:hypothetical protein